MNLLKRYQQRFFEPFNHLNMKNLNLDKQYIDRVQFTGREVLKNADEIARRNSDLQKALKLGNLHKSHVRLVIRDLFTRDLTVKVTVWAVTENYVILKGNSLVPINSITKVIF